MRIPVLLLFVVTAPGLQPLQAAERAPKSCPVDLDVRHGQGLTVTHPAGSEDGLDPFSQHDRSYSAASQTLDLSISNPGLQEIASLDGVVKTKSGEARSMRVTGSGSGFKGDRELPLHLQRTVAAHKEVAISWSVPSSNAVTSVEIMTITYLDGSTWAAPAISSCRFIPDLLMLASSR